MENWKRMIMLESNQKTFLSISLLNGVNQLSKNSNLFPNILNKKNYDTFVEEPFACKKISMFDRFSL